MKLFLSSINNLFLGSGFVTALTDSTFNSDCCKALNKQSLIDCTAQITAALVLLLGLMD